MENRFYPVKKGRILQSEGGVNFDHHFDYLPEKIELFAWRIIFGSSRGSLKKNLSKTDLQLPPDFVI